MVNRKRAKGGEAKERDRARTRKREKDIETKREISVKKK